MINSYSVKDFCEKLDGLRFITRYQGVSKMHNESVAEHSFFVAAFIYKLYDVYEFDLHKAIIAGLMHDTAETEVSDVPYPIKRDNPRLAEELSKLEMEALSKNVDAETMKILLDFNSENDAKTPEGLIVALADALEVLEYSKTEAAAGNSYMIAVNESSRERVKKLESLLEVYRR